VDINDKKHLKDAYVSLYAHFTKLMDEREKQTNLRFDAARLALDASKSELDRKLETLNELRSAVEKDRIQFVRQDVYEEKTKGYDAWCRSVDKKFAYWGGGLTALIFLLEYLMRYTAVGGGAR
jgi:hypothetical protein